MTRHPILTLHSVDDSGSPISVSRGTLARILGGVAAAGWRGCRLGEVLAGGEPGDEDRRVGLSFDDGYANVITEALPVLRDLGFTATVFTIVDRCGGDNTWPGQAPWAPRLSLLDRDGLETLRAEGWEIGSHGLSHLSLTAVDLATAARELEESRARLERWLGQPMPLFAYPYGAHDEAVRRLAGGVYEAAFGTRLALATGADLRERVRIPRVDAYYLRRLPATAVVGSASGRAYLALRRWGRAVRRLAVAR